LLPAVQSAREAARRTQCSNHLKQLALALLQYDEAHEVLPPGAFCPRPGGGSCYEIAQCHTWFEAILPNIEQQPLHQQLDFTVGTGVEPNKTIMATVQVPGVNCPSDPGEVMVEMDVLNPAGQCGGCNYIHGGAAGTYSQGASYVISAGPVNMNGCAIPAWPDKGNCQSCAGGGDWRCEQIGLPGLFAGGPAAKRMAHCRDGTSNTFLIGETLLRWNQFSMYFNSHLNVGSTNVPPNYYKINPKGCSFPALCYTSGVGRPCIPDRGGFNSYHPGGLMMAMADGSVHFVNETITYETWVYLGDRADGNPALLP
jgi:prepilin-type processing-associated H-X9-DG protein